MIFNPVLAYRSSVRICSVSDTLHTLQPRHRHDLPNTACLVSGADRCSVSSFRACMPVCVLLRAVCPGTCPPWFWHGLRCCLCCAVCPGARRGLGSPPAGHIAVVQPRPVSRPTTEKIKKAQKIRSWIFSHQKFPAKTKRPLQRVCVLCYTCLTSLEREESVK